MRIFAINLEASGERRLFMERQFAALGMAAEFFPAVDGRRLTEDVVGQLSDRKWFRRYVGRDMTRADLGCSLSHLQVYRKIVREQIPCALILEDDAWLTPSIKQIVEALEGDLQQLPVDVVLLSECITAAGTIWNKGLYFLSPVKHAYFGHAYVMTLRGANILTRHLYPIRHQADAWNWLLKHRLVRVAAIHPVMATQNQEMLESTNLGRQGGAVSPYSRSWWLRKLWRACWRLHDTCVPLRWHHGQAKTVMEEAIQECVDGSGARTGKR